MTMNTVYSRIINTFLKPQVSFQPVDSVRYASKKASGGTRNSKQMRGKHRGWKKQDGNWAYPGDILATQNKPNWLPGLNVRMGGHLVLNAMKAGRVRITCEIPNLDYNNEVVKKFFANREPGVPFFKKYYHVIPDEQHRRFKLIDQI